MHKLFIIGYAGKLLVGLLPFLYELFLIWLKKVKALWIGSLLLLVTLGSLVLTFLNTSLQEQTYKLHSLENSNADFTVWLTRNQAEAFLAEYQGVLELQPTHQDSAINAALLSQSLNKPALSQSYWELARSIDPNNLKN